MKVAVLIVSAHKMGTLFEQLLLRTSQTSPQKANCCSASGQMPPYQKAATKWHTALLGIPKITAESTLGIGLNTSRVLECSWRQPVINGIDSALYSFVPGFEVSLLATSSWVMTIMRLSLSVASRNFIKIDVVM